jgi:hypothetical protein
VFHYQDTKEAKIVFVKPRQLTSVDIGADLNISNQVQAVAQARVVSNDELIEAPSVSNNEVENSIRRPVKNDEIALTVRNDELGSVIMCYNEIARVTTVSTGEPIAPSNYGTEVADDISNEISVEERVVFHYQDTKEDKIIFVKSRQLTSVDMGADSNISNQVQAVAHISDNRENLEENVETIPNDEIFEEILEQGTVREDQPKDRQAQYRQNSQQSVLERLSPWLMITGGLTFFAINIEYILSSLLFFYKMELGVFTLLKLECLLPHLAWYWISYHGHIRLITDEIFIAFIKRIFSCHIWPSRIQFWAQNLTS